MDHFGAAMTGVKPKSSFLSPRMALPLTEALLKLGMKRHASRNQDGPLAEAKSGFTFRDNALRG